MTNQYPLLAAAGLLAVLVCGALPAQGQQEKPYAGFPADRVRMVRPDNHVPDPLYTENRVVLRKVSIEQEATGIRISGEIFTDLECDSAPVAENLPLGQLMDLMLTVQLYHYENMVGREADGRYKLPFIDQADPGREVSGQSVRVNITEKVDGFGFTKFQLPQLESPLAPGIYQVVVSLNLPAQTPGIRAAVKWVSEIFGKEIESVPEMDAAGNIIGFKEIRHDIMKDPELHEKWHAELLTRVRNLEDAAQIWVGAVKQNNRVTLVSPEAASDRNPANYLLWTKHHEFAQQVMKHEAEIEEVDEEWVARELEKFKSRDRRDKDGNPKEAEPEQIKRKEESLRSEMRRIHRDNPQLITMYGGASTEDERNMVTGALTARREVIRQIAEYQEFLVRRYWELMDGVLLFGGWHSVNVPCYRMYDALMKDNPREVEADLSDEQEALKEIHGGADGYLEARRETLANQPPEVQTEALQYYRNRYLTRTWFPGDWLEKPQGAERHLIKQGDQGTFYAWRVDFIRKFLEKTDKVIADLDTTTVYANQVWPSMLDTAKSARVDVIALAYAWEYYIRTEVLSGQGDEQASVEEKNRIKEEIRADWEKEARSRENADLDLAQFYRRAEHDSSVIKSRFDGKIARIKRFLKLKEFAFQYQRVKRAGAENEKLPGYRPPTAPAKQ